MTEVVVSSPVKENFPGHGIALWSVSVLDVNALKSRTAELRARFSEEQDGSPLLNSQTEYWVSVFSEMGVSNKKVKKGLKPSIKNLHEQYERIGFQDVLPVVDFYNALSLNLALPMAAYDADKISGDISLRFGASELTFTPMFKPDETRQASDREVFYCDDKRIICSFWNYKDCDQTRITESTKSIYIFADLNGSADDMRNTAEKVENNFTGCFSIHDMQLVTW